MASAKKSKEKSKLLLLPLYSASVSLSLSLFCLFCLLYYPNENRWSLPSFSPLYSPDLCALGSQFYNLIANRTISYYLLIQNHAYSWAIVMPPCGKYTYQPPLPSFLPQSMYTCSHHIVSWFLYIKLPSNLLHQWLFMWHTIVTGSNEKGRKWHHRHKHWSRACCFLHW